MYYPYMMEYFDCCLMPGEQFFHLYHGIVKQVIFWWDDDDVYFVLDQEA